MGLSREQFLANIPERIVEEVEVPVWGAMQIRSLDALELVSLSEWLATVEEIETRRRGTSIMAMVAVRCLSDVDGERLLQDDDLPALYRKPGAVEALPVVFAAANRINRIIVVPDEKNSEPSVSDDLPTA